MANILPIAVLLAALAGSIWLGRRHVTRSRHDHQPAPLDELLAPVEHQGATDGWSPAAEVHADPDPLDNTVPLVFGDDLVPAYTFASVMDEHPVPLDYPGPDFDAEWVAAGERLAQLGDTQVMEAVAA